MFVRRACGRSLLKRYWCVFSWRCVHLRFTEVFHGTLDVLPPVLLSSDAAGSRPDVPRRVFGAAAEAFCCRIKDPCICACQVREMEDESGSGACSFLHLSVLSQFLLCVLFVLGAQMKKLVALKMQCLFRGRLVRKNVETMNQAALRRAYSNPNRQNLEQVFAFIDSHHRGVVSVSEFTTAIRRAAMCAGCFSVSFSFPRLPSLTFVSQCCCRTDEEPLPANAAVFSYRQGNKRKRGPGCFRSCSGRVHGRPVCRMVR